MKATSHPLYGTWCNMRARCNNPMLPSFQDYGFRGIKVSKEWGDFWKFAEDMGERPTNTTLDRKDNNGDYCKENCHWATRAAQAANTRQQERFGRARVDTKALSGVRFYRGSFYAKATVKGDIFELYAGKSLFEAAAARRSFEARAAST